MELIDSFCQNFDKACIGIKPYKDACNVVENNDTEATFRKLTLTAADAEFYDFDKDKIYKSWGNWQKLSKSLLDKDCDGAVVVNHHGGNETLCLVELKSTFDTDKLFEGHKQVVFTLLKIISLFCLCKGFNWHNLQIHFVLACHPFKDDVQRSAVYNNISQQQERGQNMFLGEMLYDLLKSGSVTYKLGQLPQLKALALPQEIVEKEITYSLVMGTTFEDAGASLAI